jgi:hypothetical protein
MAESDMVTAERLKREVGVDHLVVRIAVEELGRLIIHDLAKKSGDRLALVEPLPAQLRQRAGCLGLVERDEPRHPAIGKAFMVECVEDPRAAQIGESEDGERTQVQVSEHRLESADERRVGQ